MKLYKIVILAVSLSGCLTPQQMLDKEIGPDQPQEYKDGYLDGCPSGKSAAGRFYDKFTKNVLRYSDDKLYKQGWDDGFQVCKSKYESFKKDLYY